MRSVGILFAASLFVALLPLRAQAYLPPAFYLYGQVAEQKAKTPSPALQLSVSRPLGAGTEETLGTISIPSWSPSQGGWPALSLLFTGDADGVIRSVESFGIPVTKEADLLRASREQAAAMKEAPRPFYKVDKLMGLKRYRQTYAWVHRKDDKAVWLEKDTFLPLKIQGPCPGGVADLPWAKGNSNLCELEFRQVSSLRRGNAQNARLALWKDDAPVLFFSFDRISPKSGAGDAQSKLPPDIAGIAETLLH